VTAFLWKADPDKQQEFVAHYERQKTAAQRPGARRTRRYFVDACHPLWGLELVYACWLLVGQRFLAGMGSGRKRLNILGAYCPGGQEYLDLRLTRDNINREQFVNLLRLLRATHLKTERFVLYLDHARYYASPAVNTSFPACRGRPRRNSTAFSASKREFGYKMATNDRGQTATKTRNAATSSCGCVPYGNAPRRTRTCNPLIKRSHP
jgi:hypothetical protein